MIRRSLRSTLVIRENLSAYYAGRHSVSRDECLRRARDNENTRDLWASSAREHHRMYMRYLRGLT
jgi:hypothetical protein